jgi:hypothetical protein
VLTKFASSSEQVYITPYNIVDRGPKELYGGGQGDNPDASGSFVARVEPGSNGQTAASAMAVIGD